ncbi:MAG TPA: L-dopachrome tautomerase-related protein [Woeseiaceae bacterium]|nr:L-dopachrome tautomerase-related protein [Woeseiaceae bacterium]
MKSFLLFVASIALLVAAVLRIRYGGGEPYTDLSTPPLLPESQLETVLEYPEPVGNVAVNRDGRIFFTVHPESRPQGNKLLEWVDGAAVPYPSGTVQPHLFNTILGVVIDRQNRLWTIDHGNHGFATARLLAFDLDSGELVHDHRFRGEAARAGSFLQDLQVSADGEFVFIADASFWRKRPAIVVYELATRRERRVLESHESVEAGNFLIRTPTRDMQFLGGLVSLKGGVDGLALDPGNQWLYYGALNKDDLFRIPVKMLQDPALPQRQIENAVERFSIKPLSDGMSADLAGNLYLTDIEHGAVVIVGRDQLPKTLIRSSKIRWPDGLSFGPDGWLYLTDSAIQDQVLRSKDYIRSKGPYYIYRFRPGYQGVPGH